MTDAPPGSEPPLCKCGYPESFHTANMRVNSAACRNFEPAGGASKPPLAERVDDLSELERAAKASVASWSHNELGWYLEEWLVGMMEGDAWDARFIALANPARIGELIAEIRRLRHALESQTFAYPESK